MQNSRLTRDSNVRREEISGSGKVAFRRHAESATRLDFPNAKIIAQDRARDVKQGNTGIDQVSLPTERKLIRRWKEHGDRHALLRLIMTMRPFLVSVARRHGASAGIEKDLVNEGILAVIAGLETYEVMGESRLINHVWRRVKTAMSKERHRLERVVDMPLEKLQKDRRLATEISGNTSSASSGQHTSIDDLDDILLASSKEDPERLVSASERDNALSGMLYASMTNLTDLERSVIENRLAEGRLEDLAGRLGTSLEFIRKAEMRALQKMRMSLMMNGHSGLVEEDT